MVSPGGFVFAAIGLLGCLVACAAAPVSPGEGGTGSRVTGTVGYREHVALPPTAVIKVQLVDVSRADAAAIVLGEQVFESGGRQPPFAFSIPFDPDKIDPRMSYAVQARIEVDGQLRFISDQRYPVITREASDKAELLLKSVGRDP